VTREASLGAVLRAFRELGASTDDERRGIARLLGYDLTAEAAPILEPPAPPPPPSRGEPAPVPELARSSPPPSDPAAPATELIRLPDLVRNELVLPPPIPRPAANAAPRPAASLFSPAWSRTILARLGARLAAAGTVDVTRLVDRVAARAPIHALPRRRRLVTAPAITVVLDRSGVMPWLAADQAELVAQLRALLRPAIDVVTCDGPPAVLAPDATAPDATAPDDAAIAPGTAAIAPGHAAMAPGTAATAPAIAPDGFDDLPAPAIRATYGGRVLALTDLGASAWAASDPDRVAAWRAFSAQLAAHGASLVVLTPIPDARRPRALQQLRCVHWDRRTQPSAVHALVKDLA
jgi:hypothetical protein